MKRKLDEIKRNVSEALHLNLSIQALDNVQKVMKTKLLVPSQQLVRKVVTGDEKKRVRDLLNEKKEKPHFIKLFDKISFTFFMLTVPVCQYFLLNRPDYFWLWFSVFMPVLMIIRYFYFCSIHMEYFLYDFCYFSNLLSLICIYWSPGWFFRMVFIFVNGPVTLAILVWRLSLVYHDFDRVTSIYIHILPAMLFFALRWHVIPAIQPLSIYDFLNACVGYLFWQIIYYLKTEVFDRHILDENPQLLTSLRWLAADRKNATARAVLKFCKLIRLMKPDEDYVSHEFKTKAIFMSSQFLYTMITFLPSFIVYRSMTLHLLYLIAIYSNSIYNGASFYIEIFSQRYQLQFKKKEDMQHVVQAAAEIAYHAATAVSHSPSHNVPNTTSSSFSPLTPSSISSLVSSTDQTDPIESETGDSPVSRVRDAPEEKVDNNEERIDGNEEEKERVEGERRKNESIRHAIKKATSAFVDHWAASELALTEEREGGGYGLHPDIHDHHDQEELSDAESERGRSDSLALTDPDEVPETPQGVKEESRIEPLEEVKTVSELGREMWVEDSGALAGGGESIHVKDKDI